MPQTAAPLDLRPYVRAIDAAPHMKRGRLLTAGELDNFEHAHAVALPTLYRRILREIGDGVGGDARCRLRIPSLDEAMQMAANQGADVATAFPYGRVYAEAIRARLENESFAEVMTSPDIRSRQRTGEGLPPGCLPIGDFGGGEMSLLVVTGEERGRVWRHGQADCPEGGAHYGAYGGEGRAPLEVDQWIAFWAKVNGLTIEPMPEEKSVVGIR